MASFCPGRKFLSLLDDVQFCGIFEVMIKPYLLLLFFLGSINLGFAQEVYQAHAHVQLVSEQDAIVPGKIFLGGNRLSFR